MMEFRIEARVGFGTTDKIGIDDMAMRRDFSHNYSTYCQSFRVMHM